MALTTVRLRRQYRRHVDDAAPACRRRSPGWSAPMPASPAPPARQARRRSAGGPRVARGFVGMRVTGTTGPGASNGRHCAGFAAVPATTPARHPRIRKRGLRNQHAKERAADRAAQMTREERVGRAGGYPPASPLPLQGGGCETRCYAVHRQPVRAWRGRRSGGVLPRPARRCAGRARRVTVSRSAMPCTSPSRARLRSVESCCLTPDEAGVGGPVEAAEAGRRRARRRRTPQ